MVDLIFFFIKNKTIRGVPSKIYPGYPGLKLVNV